MSDFTAGTEPVVFDVERPQGQRRDLLRVGLSVRSSRSSSLRGSELLATITNDAWFGRSSAPYQHFEQGAIRAVEEGRYVVRAANTGISGAVDPYGRVLLKTPLFEAAAVTVGRAAARWPDDLQPPRRRRGLDLAGDCWRCGARGLIRPGAGQASGR